MKNTTLNEFELLESMLSQFGQQHLLRFWNELDAAARNQLLEQIEAIDWDEINGLIRDSIPDDQWHQLASRAEAPPAITLSEFADPQQFAQAHEIGADAIRKNEVAFVLTAGGQGSRLGFDQPKGMYPIGPVSNRTLYQFMIDHAQARARQFNACIPVYIMTSPQTDAATRNFLNWNNWFGNSRRDIRIFCQGTMPAIDLATGRVLLNAKGEISTSPDGHGGMLKALDRSGCLDELGDRGIESIFYGQVDNPLLQICNPALIGFHRLQKSEMTTQVIRKNDPMQKVGNTVMVDGRVRIIEYSDLPEVYARQRNPDGTLKLWAGSIAVHIFERQFLERARDHAGSLPFHRATKKVQCLNDLGQLIQPDECNAIKFERFIFDLLPLADRALVCEVDPADGFAALKNSPPATTETAEWVKNAIVNLHTKWIRRCGGHVDEGALVEISPFFAVDEEQLKARSGASLHITDSVFLETGSH